MDWDGDGDEDHDDGLITAALLFGPWPIALVALLIVLAVWLWW